MSNFNYSNFVSKSTFFITKNEIRQTIKRCKSNNASKLDDIFNRIFKIFVNKLMSHLINLFRVCATLNYHSRCFRETHIIILKKLDKKNYTNIKTYKSIVLLNIFDKTFESIIARRINDLTEAYDIFFVNQIKKRKNRNCENSLEIVYKANSHCLKHEQKQNNDIIEHECNRRLRSCLSRSIVAYSQKKRILA
jgi:hypothetical protein